MVRQKGFEPMTRGLEGRCSSPSELLARWSGRLDSNQRPPAPKAGALPGCATPRQIQFYGSLAGESNRELISNFRAPIRRFERATLTAICEVRKLRAIEAPHARSVNLSKHQTTSPLDTAVKPRIGSCAAAQVSPRVNNLRNPRSLNVKMKRDPAKP